MTKEQNSILQVLGENTQALARLGVRRLGLFGSCARGDQTPSSDLDFVVTFERKSFDAFMDLKFLLEDLFGRPVDLVLDDAIKPRLRDSIMREVVYAPGL